MADPRYGGPFFAMAALCYGGPLPRPTVLTEGYRRLPKATEGRCQWRRTSSAGVDPGGRVSWLRTNPLPLRNTDVWQAVFTFNRRWQISAIKYRYLQLIEDICKCGLNVKTACPNSYPNLTLTLTLILSNPNLNSNRTLTLTLILRRVTKVRKWTKADIGLR